MGIYAERVLPRLQDRVMARGSMRVLRARVCAGLSGDVVEIGFGTGLNLEFYPSEVERVRAVEPSALCLRLAGERIAAADVAVEPSGLTGERLDLPSDSADAVVSTWTMCTIPDLPAALGEIRRVLKPGGRLHFVEHGHDSDPGVARWQRRLEPIQKRLAGGCHLTRDIPAQLAAAGFDVDELDTFDVEGEPRAFGHTFLGRAG